MLKDYFLPVEKNYGFAMEGYYVWCGSVVKGDDGRYYMFASRIPKTQDFHPGWMFLSEVVRASADKPWGPFTFEEVVLTDRGAQFWDGRMAHNPRIIKHDGKYFLFYVGTTFAFPIPDDECIKNDDPRTMSARSRKRIGVAVSDTVNGKFERMDDPVLDTRPHHFDNLLVSNPSPLVDADGSVLLLYKSRPYNPKPYKNPTHGNMQFGMARAKDIYSKYERLTDEPMFTADLHLEDPFIWRDENGYCMLAKDMTGNIAEKLGEGMFATSKDGVNWDVEKGKSAYTKEVLWADGTITTLGSMERAGLLFEDNVATCAYFAVSDGTDGFNDANNTWNLAIPLKPGITCV